MLRRGGTRWSVFGFANEWLGAFESFDFIEITPHLTIFGGLQSRLVDTEETKEEATAAAHECHWYLTRKPPPGQELFLFSYSFRPIDEMKNDPLGHGQ